VRPRFASAQRSRPSTQARSAKRVARSDRPRRRVYGRWNEGAQLLDEKRGLAVPLRHFGQLVRVENEHGGSTSSRTTGILRPCVPALAFRSALLLALNEAWPVVGVAMLVRPIGPVQRRMKTVMRVCQARREATGDHNRRSHRKHNGFS
jgi:hypothetical protein